MRRIFSQTRNGFTLVELLVAIGLFSVTVAIAAGGFVSALRTERQTAALVSANSNVSLAIEQMARELRTGFDFCVNGQSCPDPSVLSFKNVTSQVVTYCLNSGAIWRGGAGTCAGSGFQKITADDVNVQFLKFIPVGSNAPGSCDNLQPRVTIALGVSAKELGVQGSVNLQTTASVRFPLDC